MTPVTTRRRGSPRVDMRRRQGVGRSAGQLPTLFDAAPAGALAPVAPPALGAPPVLGAPPAPGAPPALGAPPCRSPPVRVDAGERAAEPAMTAGHGETLDRLVVSSWERLAAHADAPCLLCGGTMEPRYGAHAASIGGRCRDCGTTLG